MNRFRSLPDSTVLRIGALAEQSFRGQWRKKKFGQSGFQFDNGGVMTRIQKKILQELNYRRSENLDAILENEGEEKALEITTEREESFEQTAKAAPRQEKAEKEKQSD